MILSPVRSNKIRLKQEEADPSGERRKFGHLLLQNRMCVAMSRQRRLLIVVGDDTMFKSPDGKATDPGSSVDNAIHPVPGLPLFLDMCRSPRGLHTSAT